MSDQTKLPTGAFNLPPGVSLKDIDPGEEPIGSEDEPWECGCGTMTMNSTGVCNRCQNEYDKAEARRDYGR